jgi:hypothetical protein
MTHTAPTAATGEDRQRWIALVVLCLGFLMIILDATIVNVALPTIQKDLGFSQSGLAWVVNRPAGRPDRAQARLHDRPRGLHRGLAALRNLR